MPRKLRIAATTFFALLTLAIFAVWVGCRNSIHTAGLRPTSQCWIFVTALEGELEFCVFQGGPLGPADYWYGYETLEVTHINVKGATRIPRFNWQQNSGELRIVAPTLFWAAIAAIASAVPWIPCRFFLRTAFLALTLGALTLGLIAWTTR